MLPHLRRTTEDLTAVVAAADPVIAGPLSVAARIVAEQAGGAGGDRHAPADGVPVGRRSARTREAPLAGGAAFGRSPGCAATSGCRRLGDLLPDPALAARLADGTPLVLVAVAAILVAGIRLAFLDTERLLREGGPRRVACAVPLSRGEEMGWFEHGSTILVLVPAGWRFGGRAVEGEPIRAGSALLAPGPDHRPDGRPDG